MIEGVNGASGRIAVELLTEIVKDGKNGKGVCAGAQPQRSIVQSCSALFSLVGSSLGGRSRRWKTSMVRSRSAG
jgi:hypothetical protein